MSRFRSFAVAAFLWAGSLAILMPLGYLIFDKVPHQVAYHTTMIGGVTWMSVSQFRNERRDG